MSNNFIKTIIKEGSLKSSYSRSPCGQSMFMILPFLCLPLDTWHKDGGRLKQGDELATLPPNAMAQDGTSLTQCSLTLVSSLAHNNAKTMRFITFWHLCCAVF